MNGYAPEYVHRKKSNTFAFAIRTKERMFLTGKPDILKVMGNITTQTAAENLAMVVLPKTAWEGVVSEIQELKNILQKKSEEEVNNQWIESTQARKMLGISPKTWQTYRDERRIPFSQFGRKIYVKRADLEAFMESHYIQSR